MNNKSCFCVLALAMCLAGPQTVAMGFETFDFEDLTVSDVYHVGDPLTTGGETFSMSPFQWANSSWTSNGSCQVHNAGMAGGTGNDLELNNINLGATFGTAAPFLIVLIGEYGGNVNLEVNGDFRNVGSFDLLNNQVVGGATVAVTSLGLVTGALYLHGAISSFKIGGQELWIDDLTIPEPATLSLLALGSLGLMRRKRRG